MCSLSLLADEAVDGDGDVPGIEPMPNDFHGNALLLEDNPFDAAVMHELLEKFSNIKLSVTHAPILKDAVALLSRGDFTVALIDLNVPDSRGLDTVRDAIRANPSVPVIVLTAWDRMDVAMEALKIGAQDYLPKSELNNRTLSRVIQYAVQRKEKENELVNRAHFDSLTGLANRTLLYDRWRRSLARAKQTGTSTGVLVAGLDQFNRINDRYGYPAGDALLKHIAAMLAASVKETDIVARLGGDEFIIVLECLRSLEELEDTRDRMMALFRDAFTHDGETISFSASIGAAHAGPGETEDLMAVIKRADDEMYRFKTDPRLPA